MSAFQPKMSEVQKLLPHRTRTLIKMQAKSPMPTQPREQEFIARCNELAKRARRGFQHDGPGGSYDGF